VTYNGASYISIVSNNLNYLPTNLSFWSVLAQKGDAGSQGLQGVKGDTGPQGLQGIQGIRGLTGTTGVAGPQGSKGDPGTMGAPGLKGDTGGTGPQGIQGVKGDIGAIGPSGLTWKGSWDGAKTYILRDSVNYNGSSYVSISGTNTGNAPPNALFWELLALKGDTGVAGATGDTGAPGPQGIPGMKGDTGLQGIQGPKGDAGTIGAQGPKGDLGAPGVIGPQGIQGVKGDPGTPGPIGAAGPAGITWKGTWDIATNYNLRDSVNYNGTSYICIAASNTGIVPTNTSFWAVMAQKGDTGPQGVPGTPGGSGTVTDVALSGGTTGLNVTGSPITTNGTMTLNGTLAVANGSTGATTTTTALSNLGGAARGVNSDITSLTGLTVPLSALQGGTGATTGLAGLQKKIGKVAIVAQSGGDYTSPVTAMTDIATWCGTPSATNPCLVKVMPGIYDLAGGTLVMQSNVDLEGAGEAMTTITSTNSTATIQVDGNEVRFLTVINNAASGADRGGIIITTTWPATATLDNLTIIVSGGTGIKNNYGNLIMNNVKITATGGTGVYNESGVIDMRYVTITDSVTGVSISDPSKVTISNTTITASGTGISTWGDNNPVTIKHVTIIGPDTGVYNGSICLMDNVSITASSYGVLNGRVLTMRNVTIDATGKGIESWTPMIAMSNIKSRAKIGFNIELPFEWGNNLFLNIDNSVFEGSVYSILSNVSLNIGGSKIIGPILPWYYGVLEAQFKCVASYDGNYVALGTNCYPVP
jgi:hypothetical protein